MTRSRALKSMSIAELVARFEEISLAYAAASETFQNALANRLFAKKRAVLSELRHKERDERAALYVLYSHRHPQVRLDVATSTYALNPEKATAIIREVANSRMFPFAGDAGMELAGIEDGTSMVLLDLDY